MAERDEDERRDRNQRAAAGALGAVLGTAMAGLPGAVAGVALGPLLEPMVSGVWAELPGKARQHQTSTLFWAIHYGVPVEEVQERIDASEQTQLLTAFALSGAARTAWEDKVRTLGRSLANGLPAEDNATIDTEQMIIAAVTDIEGPQLAMLELMVALRPGRNAGQRPSQSSRGFPLATPRPVSWGRSSAMACACSGWGRLQRSGCSHAEHAWCGPRAHVVAD